MFASHDNYYLERRIVDVTRSWHLAKNKTQTIETNSTRNIAKARNRNCLFRSFPGCAVFLERRRKTVHFKCWISGKRLLVEIFTIAQLAPNQFARHFWVHWWVEICTSRVWKYNFYCLNHETISDSASSACFCNIILIWKDC